MLIYKGEVLNEPGNVDFGSADISGIGDGTVTGAIGELNSKLTEQVILYEKRISVKEYTPGTTSFCIDEYIVSKNGYFKIIRAIPTQNYLLATVSLIRNETWYLTIHNTSETSINADILLETICVKIPN